MVATYDPSTVAGRVRLLISDTVVSDEAIRIFDDAEIAAFLALESDSVLNAAALALDAIAASEILIQKRIRILELETDGPAEAKALGALAATYRERELAGAGVDIEDEWAIAEFVTNDSTWHERIAGEVARGA